jgi:hypothetical protein
MQHDPTQLGPQDQGIEHGPAAATTNLSDHLMVEHQLNKLTHDQLRAELSRHVSPDGPPDLAALHTEDHRTGWELGHEHTPDELCLCPDHDTRPPHHGTDAELGPELPAGELLAWGIDPEQAFDQLNPDFGTLADGRDPAGHRDVQDREAGLALGTRVAVAAARENDPSPILEIAGQDYRVADAAREARSWPTPAASWPATVHAWAAVPEAEHDWGWER